VSSADAIRQIVGYAARAGSIPDPECPGTLALVTGSPLNAYRALTLDDDFYTDALVAWRQQAEWDRDTHYAWARLALRMWPVSDGQVAVAEMRGQWVWSWRRFGASDQAIADRLGVALDTLRRTGALRHADEFARRPMSSESRRWERCPLVVATEREDPPRQDQRWQDFRLDRLYPRQIAERHAEFTRLTKAGPPRPAGRDEQRAA
jgi:hypothetical protein